MKGSTVVAVLIGGAVLVGAAVVLARPKRIASPIVTQVGKRYRFKASIRPRMAGNDALALKQGLEASGAKNVVMDFTASAGTFVEFDQVEAFSVTITPGVTGMTLQGHTLTIDDVKPLADSGAPIPQLGGASV